MQQLEHVPRKQIEQVVIVVTSVSNGGIVVVVIGALAEASSIVHIFGVSESPATVR